MASKNNSSGDVIPMGKAIAIIVGVVVGVVGIIGGGLFFGVQALNTNPTAVVQNEPPQNELVQNEPAQNEPTQQSETLFNDNNEDDDLTRYNNAIEYLRDYADNLNVEQDIFDNFIALDENTLPEFAIPGSIKTYSWHNDLGGNYFMFGEDDDGNAIVAIVGLISKDIGIEEKEKYCSIPSMAAIALIDPTKSNFEDMKATFDEVVKNEDFGLTTSHIDGVGYTFTVQWQTNNTYLFFGSNYGNDSIIDTETESNPSDTKNETAVDVNYIKEDPNGFEGIESYIQGATFILMALEIKYPEMFIDEVRYFDSTTDDNSTMVNNVYDEAGAEKILLLSYTLSNDSEDRYWAFLTQDMLDEDPVKFWTTYPDHIGYKPEYTKFISDYWDYATIYTGESPHISEFNVSDSLNDRPDNSSNDYEYETPYHDAEDIRGGRDIEDLSDEEFQEWWDALPVED